MFSVFLHLRHETLVSLGLSLRAVQRACVQQILSNHTWIKQPTSTRKRFPIKRLQSFSNIISNKPGCIRLSVFLPGRPPAAALSSVAFCSLMATITLNGPPLFLSTVKRVFLFQENHIWMYTKPFVHRALHPWYPSSHRPFNTVDSGDQTGFGLHFMLSC